MRQLTVIAHAPSSNLSALARVLQEGAAQADISVSVLSPLEADANAALNADALILLTPENLGYMSGAMKDWFDRIYYPCLDHTQGKPIAAVVRAGHDGTGTQQALKTITTGLRWRWVQPVLLLRGDWQADFIQQAQQLGEAMGYALEQGMI
ncbi:flavodoxin [Bacterioplanes sanyensis]|uniref:Flavodoxin n=1 Tax=Bacterioplanes sanyensis TaxID=1249553 RepID=A0A222FMM1_9GAMM|nr:NAD(P)H-dependent oxidoreductase [Bacterioplanes sanyensis]ASP39922.1 flavodoxin [Bacterioplanes sanyensis]